MFAADSGAAWFEPFKVVFKEGLPSYPVHQGSFSRKSRF